jgi:hypothetical protein
LRPFNKRLRRSSSAAGGRLRLGALLLSAVLVGRAAPAEAAETYRGDDPDSYECSSDYKILNRFSAPPGVSAARSTKYSDIKFTLENNVISVKDASTSKDLAYISVGEDAKYCVFKDVQVIEAKKLWRKECNTKYHGFRLRIIVDEQLPVRPFGFPGRLPAEKQPFDKMDHSINVKLYRTAEGKKKGLAPRCLYARGTPEISSYRLHYLDPIETADKSAVSISEEAPFDVREAGGYSKYEREALKKAGPGVPRPK